MSSLLSPSQLIATGYFVVGQLCLETLGPRECLNNCLTCDLSLLSEGFMNNITNKLYESPSYIQNSLALSYIHTYTATLLHIEKSLLPSVLTKSAGHYQLSSRGLHLNEITSLVPIT